MKIWLVEDDGFKRQRVRAAALEVFPGATLIEARSAKSAMKLMTGEHPDLIVLDMSLPTFDIGPEESGGRPQGFGGLEILREMDRRSLTVPVVVVTQYEVFGEEKLGVRELAKRMQQEHPERFVELVHYDTTSGQWKSKFEDAIRSAVAARSSK